MAALIVLNGPPAAGKSTIGRMYADQHPLCLRIDVDEIRESLGSWRQAQRQAGLRARALATAMARDHLGAGHDVVVAQLYGVPDHLVELVSVAAATGAAFHEIVLMTDVASTIDRFIERGGPRLADARSSPDGLDAIGALHERVEALAATRAGAVVVTSVRDDVDGTYAAVLDALR
jgi:predicted kinase